jgi:predicted transcriptional regulator of viral defense system
MKAEDESKTMKGMASNVRQTRMKKGMLRGISGKELEAISFLELEGKRFFSRADVKRFFGSPGEMAVYIHRLARKGRVVKISRDRYYLVPIQAYQGKWSEHPYIVIDEMFGGKGYAIGGKSAANYWGFVEQIPSAIDVFSQTRQGRKEMFGFTIRFRRVRNIPRSTTGKVKGHQFIIAAKGVSKKWK